MMIFMTIDECRIINFKKIHDIRGNLLHIENNKDVPFVIKRVYYLYDVPSGANRGGHSHLETKQVIIAISGSFNVILDNGTERKSILLNRPDFGLYITPCVWREIENFSSNSIALVLASTLFCEEDYIRDYTIFKKKQQ
jgi:oxalate decarboxylase/phosphoglucose isomerase-like protein (cupin superfamily)